MTVLRAIWNFVRTVTTSLWRLIKTIADAIGTIVSGILGPPARALKRLVSAIIQRIWRMVEVLLAAWARIFQRAPRAPRDPTPTPGRHILPMWGMAIASLWYVVPWGDWFELSTGWFAGVVFATAIAVGLVLRVSLRADPLGRFGCMLLDSSRLVGLIYFDRFFALAVLVAWWQLWAYLYMWPLLILASIAVVSVLIQPFETRQLSDDLPTLPDLDTAPPEGGVVNRRFAWSLNWEGQSHEFTVEVDIDSDRFLQMQSTNPIAPSSEAQLDFSPWVIDGWTSEVDRVASSVRSQCKTLGYTQFQESTAVLAFAQSVDYQLDEDTTDYVEYWRYPIETLYEETGDCEDTTILALAVLRRLGYRIMPLTMPQHAALGVEAPVSLKGTFVVHEGQRYYYCETTAEGFAIGKIPDEIDPQTISLWPLRVEV